MYTKRQRNVVYGSIFSIALKQPYCSIAAQRACSTIITVYFITTKLCGYKRIDCGYREFTPFVHQTQGLFQCAVDDDLCSVIVTDAQITERWVTLEQNLHIWCTVQQCKMPQEERRKCTLSIKMLPVSGGGASPPDPGWVGSMKIDKRSPRPVSQLIVPDVQKIGPQVTVSFQHFPPCRSAVKLSA